MKTYAKTCPYQVNEVKLHAFLSILYIWRQVVGVMSWLLFHGERDPIPTGEESG
jgi:hypothetical protein